MMIKFHKAGASGRAAAEYLEGDKDHQGRPREHVEVLRGDPFRVGQIVDSLDFKHRRTAGVIAWAPADNPTPEQIDEVLDNFERLAWSGLDPDRYAWSAVRHDDPSGGVHVHIMAARVDLQTGKSLNIAPPTWQMDFDPLGAALNIKHGWARPDRPARSSDVHIESYEKKIKAEAVKSGEPLKTDITRLYGDVGHSINENTASILSLLIKNLIFRWWVYPLAMVVTALIIILPGMWVSGNLIADYMEIKITDQLTEIHKNEESLETMRPWRIVPGVTKDTGQRYLVLPKGSPKPILRKNDAGYRFVMLGVFEETKEE